MRNFIIHESVLDTELTQIQKTPLGTIKFVTILQEADRQNRNKRIYPKTVIDEAIHTPYIQERLATKTLYGEAGHPMDTSVARQTTIVQTNAAFIIEKMWWEGNLLYGLCETANTTLGRDMAGLIEQGSRVAFSLRAQGNVNRDPVSGGAVVQPGMQMITFDWVVNPSHDKAFIQSAAPETRTSLFGAEKVSEAAIREACMLCESGNMYEIEEETMEIINENYVPGYNQKIRARKDIYILQEGDKLESAKGQFGEVVNGNVHKRVVLEDFFRQDIRKTLLSESVKEKEYSSLVESPSARESARLSRIAANPNNTDWYDRLEAREKKAAKKAEMKQKIADRKAAHFEKANKEGRKATQDEIEEWKKIKNDIRQEYGFSIEEAVEADQEFSFLLDETTVTPVHCSGSDVTTCKGEVKELLGSEKKDCDCKKGVRVAKTPSEKGGM